MCGIAGLWKLDGQPVSLDILKCFKDSLAQRGPDGNGFYIDSQANVGLGHRRLAILDTSEGGPVAIREQDNETLHQAWIYVQAAALMRLFQEQRRVYT